MCAETWRGTRCEAAAGPGDRSPARNKAQPTALRTGGPDPDAGPSPWEEGVRFPVSSSAGAGPGLRLEQPGMRPGVPPCSWQVWAPEKAFS